MLPSEQQHGQLLSVDAMQHSQQNTYALHAALGATFIYTPWRASCHRARVKVLLVLARHLALQHRQLLAVHGAGKHGVRDAHDQPRPQRSCPIHLEEQDADDHGHPCHLQQGAGISKVASDPHMSVP